MIKKILLDNGGGYGHVEEGRMVEEVHFATARRHPRTIPENIELVSDQV